MDNEFVKRVSEPSTISGMGVAALGVAQLFDNPQVAQGVEVAVDAGTSFATGGPLFGVATLIFGLASMFMKEKGRG
ncbi:hypothetical protein [Terasakiella sp. SH-1]|uniref:hypothetical protein n=1 Tax=Terasakiella sp. SH-1 TaxID=2560057 RepID=UPI001073D7A5|nr:hypothetical protein [Terasakiella sp. SH-1]